MSHCPTLYEMATKQTGLALSSLDPSEYIEALCHVPEVFVKNAFGEMSSFRRLEAYQKCGKFDNLIDRDMVNSAVRREENLLRKMFATDRNNPALSDQHVSLVSIFDEPDLFKPCTDPWVHQVPKLLAHSWAAPNAFSPVVTTSSSEFKTNFEVFTGRQLASMDWTGVFVAGGSVLASLMPAPPGKHLKKSELRDHYLTQFNYSDIDLFLYGMTPEEANKKVVSIYESLQEENVLPMTIVRTKNAVTITSQYPMRNIQIILRIYKSPAEILMGFDVDCCSVGFDGEKVWCTPRALCAMTTRLNVVEPETRRSMTYEQRLTKYSTRGFAVAVPDLKKECVNPLIYESRYYDRLEGLAKLIMLDKKFLDSPFLAKCQTDPENSRWSRMSDYSHVFIPWGPETTAKKVENMLQRKEACREYTERNSKSYFVVSSDMDKILTYKNYTNDGPGLCSYYSDGDEFSENESEWSDEWNEDSEEGSDDDYSSGRNDYPRKKPASRFAPFGSNNSAPGGFAGFGRPPPANAAPSTFGQSLFGNVMAPPAGQSAAATATATTTLADAVGMLTASLSGISFSSPFGAAPAPAPTAMATATPNAETQAPANGESAATTIPSSTTQQQDSKPEAGKTGENEKEKESTTATATTQPAPFAALTASLTEKGQVSLAKNVVPFMFTPFGSADKEKKEGDDTQKPPAFPASPFDPRFASPQWQARVAIQQSIRSDLQNNQPAAPFSFAPPPAPAQNTLGNMMAPNPFMAPAPGAPAMGAMPPSTNPLPFSFAPRRDPKITFSGPITLADGTDVAPPRPFASKHRSKLIMLDSDESESESESESENSNSDSESTSSSSSSQSESSDDRSPPTKAKEATASSQPLLPPPEPPVNEEDLPEDDPRRFASVSKPAKRDAYYSGQRLNGPLSWITEDPGRQIIGSFHPLSGDDWDKQVYCRPPANKCYRVAISCPDTISNNQRQTLTSAVAGLVSGERGLGRRFYHHDQSYILTRDGGRYKVTVDACTREEFEGLRKLLMHPSTHSVADVVVITPEIVTIPYHPKYAPKPKQQE